MLFVFGTRLVEPAHIVVDYWQRNQARYVVLTGGNNRVSGVNEAEAHLNILLEGGVPCDRIIMENKSTNTFENVVYAIPELNKVTNLGSITSVAVVAKWYHCRRAMMTLKRNLPVKAEYFALVYEPQGAERINWWQTAEGERQVLKEWESIPKYLAKGDIAAVHIHDGAYM